MDSRSATPVTSTGPGIPGDAPSIARVYDAATKGKDNRASDRDVVKAMTEIAPELPEATLANLEFVPRGVEAASKLGVTQWLNLGCGLPQVGEETTLETARRIHPDARVAYVDNDPSVAIFGRALLVVEDGAMVLEADARDVDTVLAHVRGLLDLDQRVGIVATALAHFWPDVQKPGDILHRYMAAFPGGYLVFSHARSDLLTADELDRLLTAYKRTADIYPRPLSRIREMFLNGLPLLEPGLVEASRWRPTDPLPRNVGKAHFVAAVASFGSCAEHEGEESAT
ncbi:SAM-dependent methyltransferase [Nonomuraea sp. CA-143628]|uniref:SAM-dependent methyltransferase n=1 Tax=Nonomuraea sp. CA-143628 TaxID=3239997 RepID=UPI003D8F423B